MTNDPGSIRSFPAHSAKIGVLVPTWYKVDENGLVTGAPNPLVLTTAQSEELPVMPIVSLEGKAEFHALAGSVAAQERPNLTADSISAPDAEQLAKEYSGKIDWDAGDRSSFFYFCRNQMREWVFFTDLHTFRERYQLAEERSLEGFCA